MVGYQIHLNFFITVFSSRKRTLQEQIMETLPLVLDVIKLLLQVIFYTLEAFCRLIIPIKPTPVKEELVLVSCFINFNIHQPYVPYYTYWSFKL